MAYFHIANSVVVSQGPDNKTPNVQNKPENLGFSIIHNPLTIIIDYDFIAIKQ